MKERLKQLVTTILTLEARILLALHKPKIIAITGSVGKTSTKDAVAVALSATYTVHKSPKSFNSEFGVPLTILNLPNAWNSPVRWALTIVRGAWRIFTWWRYPEVLVLEIGADKPGDIGALANWLAIDVVIITAVPEVPVHVAYYPTPEAVLKEKGSLLNGLKKDGLLITGDDERIMTLTNPYGETQRIEKPVTTIHAVGNAPLGMHSILGEHELTLLGVLGEHQGYAPAFALATALHMGVPASAAITALTDMERTPGRMRLIPGKEGSTIIDDSYNSSPTALAAALQTLAQIETTARKIAIIGDMRELGEHTQREHRRAGIRAAQVIDELYTVGEYTPTLAQAAQEEGLAPEHIHTFTKDAATEAGKACAATLQKGDIVLVKSSQGTLRLEKAVKELMAEPEKAGKLLVRQEKEWLNR